MAYGYTLVGKAGRLSPDYVPSLIGVGYRQEEPGPDDMYFERAEDVSIDDLTLARSQWVNYDSLPAGSRDPILALKSARGSFYCPAGELREQFVEAGKVNALARLDAFLAGRSA